MHLKDNEKKIIIGVIQGSREREQRRKNRQQTELDIQIDKAIEKAKKEMEVSAYGTARELIIAKLHESIETGTPWEFMGNTLCGRRMFYLYRQQYMRRIAENLGVIRDTNKTKKRIKYN